MGAHEAAQQELVDACLGHESELNQLSLVDFGPLSARTGVTPVNDLAEQIVSDRNLYCPPNRPDRLAVCARWCVVSWTRLVGGVEKARLASGGQASEIVSLLP
jgi:hypothetical protein